MSLQNILIKLSVPVVLASYNKQTIKAVLLFYFKSFKPLTSIALASYTNYAILFLVIPIKYWSKRPKDNTHL